MIDIHSHVIPNVDDGSRSIKESLEMLRHSAEIGVTDVICTPHFSHKRFVTPIEEIKKNFELLVEEAKKEEIPINLYLGQEILYTSRENILQMLDEGKLLTLNNSKYVLVEFHTTHRPDELEDIIYRFNLHKYHPIIAHIERYKWLTMEDVILMKNQDCELSVNADAVIGENGFKLKRFCKKMIKKGFIDYVTSDMHYFRPSNMDKALKKIKDEKLFNNRQVLEK